VATKHITPNLASLSISGDYKEAMTSLDQMARLFRTFSLSKKKIKQNKTNILTLFIWL
jgi:hypothetical protein